MSARQAKKRRIRARKLRDLRWLSENPKLFELQTSGFETRVELRDFGYLLQVAVQNDAGDRFGVSFDINCLSKRVDKHKAVQLAGQKLLEAAKAADWRMKP